MTTLLCRVDSIERKIDKILDKLDDMNGVKGFGVSLLANVVGNVLDGKR